MDFIIYKYLGYKTNSLINESAIKIQKMFRNYKDYHHKKQQDIIYNRIPIKDDLDNDISEELLYWKFMRNSIKKNYESAWILI